MRLIVFCNQNDLMEKLCEYIDSEKDHYKIVGTIRNIGLLASHFSLFMPDIVILDQSSVPVGLPKYINQLTSIKPNVQIILINESATSDIKSHHICSIISYDELSKDVFISALGKAEKSTSYNSYDLPQVPDDISLKDLLHNNTGTVYDFESNTILLLVKIIYLHGSHTTSAASVLKMINKLLATYPNTKALLIDSFTICVGIFNNKDSNYFHIFLNLSQNLKGDSNTHIILISNTPRCFPRLYDNYQDIVSLSKYTFFAKDADSLSWDTVIPSQNRVSLSVLEKRLSQIKDRLLTLDIPGVYRAIERLFAKDIKQNYDFHAFEYASQKISQIINIFSEFLNIENTETEVDKTTCIENYISNTEKILFHISEQLKIKNLSINKNLFFSAEYLHEHFNEDVSLDTVSEMLGISPNYLSSLFKKFFGVNFTVYLNNIRLSESIKLLKKNIPVKDIANMVGFHDTGYFIRVFSNKFGTSPHKFRNSIK